MKTLYTLNEYLFEFQYNKKFHIIQKYQKLLNIQKKKLYKSQEISIEINRNLTFQFFHVFIHIIKFRNQRNQKKNFEQFKRPNIFIYPSFHHLNFV